MTLYHKTLHQLHALLETKQVSAVEITRAVIQRIDAVEGDVQAYLTETRGEALEKARAVDEKISRGETLAPLAGVPGAIKDNICTQGVRTTCASKILEQFVPPYQAAVMEKLAAQDAVIMGKANLDEFAMGGSTETSAYHLSRNPWDLTAVPGGSSGGSAAAVAAGEAIWSLGSDTGGSIRQPAAFCGLVGLKPTYGRVSRYGLVAYASSLDQIGPITRDVTDCALVLNAISGYDRRDSTSIDAAAPDYTQSLVGDVKGLKIGLPREYFAGGIDPAIKDAVDKAVKQFAAWGAEVREVSLPHTEYALSAYYLIASAEASSNLARYDGVGFGYRDPDASDIIDMYKKTRSRAFGAEVKRRVMMGTYALSSGYYDAYYLRALKVRTLVKQDFDRAFADVDVLVAPITPTPAYRIGALSDPLSIYLQDIFAVPVNLAGIPGISIPCGFSRGLPVGMQLLAKPLAEATLLRAAYTFEQHNAYHKQVAPLGGDLA